MKLKKIMPFQGSRPSNYTDNQRKTMLKNDSKYIKISFEKEFLRIPLKKQIKKCDRYELVPLFKRWMPANQPILEAGCGSGRWVAWAMDNGWKVVGLDWSEVLCAKAKAAIPCAGVVPANMCKMPFLDKQFGSIIALGSIEHSVEGPEAILREFARVLRPEGIAIITVPFFSLARRLSRCITLPLQCAKASSTLSRVFQKSGWDGRALREARSNTVLEWFPDFGCDKEGWAFFQYNFTKGQMRNFLRLNRFEIIEELVALGDEGILQNFGRLAGYFDDLEGVVVFSPLGKIISRLLPVSLVGHMLCYVVRCI